MKRKAVFMDIDGTLMQKGVITEGVVSAISMAREDGHMFFICSGRSKGHLPKILRDADFIDGFVMSCGMYCEVRGEIIFRELVRRDDLRAAAKYFYENKKACRFDGETKMIAFNYFRDDCLCIDDLDALEAEFEAAKQERERQEMERELARKQKKEKAQEQLLANEESK